MFQATVLLAMLFCITFSASSAGPAGRDTSLGLRFDEEDDTFPEEHSIAESDSRVDSFGEFGSILSLLRNQFKGILEEIGLQLFSYLAKILQHFKVKLLRKLGMYTLSDVFHTVFDGVTDFVAESSPNDFYDDIKEPGYVKPLKSVQYSLPLPPFFKSSK